MRMNEFISPHQNININISYNLGNQDAIPKVVFGKKIDKIMKSTVKEQQKSYFKISKKYEGYSEAPEQLKKTKLSKKSKAKKKSNIMLTLPDQQQPLPRRLKTEGNTKTQATGITLKKQLKSHTKALSKTNTQHFKSLNNPPLYSHSKSQSKKPITSFSKQKKQERRNSNKSCILYQQKKLLLSDVEHLISTTTNGVTAVNKQTIKKRANSANVIKSDKFINKLLDMSVLTSQLGGSIPMNQDKNKVNQNTNNRIKAELQGFMSSVDMRIIKKMEQDNQSKKCIMVDFKIGEGLQLIAFLTKIRRIPLEKLNERATKIQRFWRKKQTQTVIPYYSNMFFRNPAINSKAAIEQHLSEISGIHAQDNIEEELMVFDTAPEGKKREEPAQFLSLISGPNLFQSSNSEFQQSSISAAKIRKMTQNRPSAAKSSNFSPQISKKQQEWRVEQFEKSTGKNWRMQQKEESSIDLSSSNKSNSLNIEKYRQLVKQKIEEQQKPVPKFTKGNLKLEQVEQAPVSNDSNIPRQQSSGEGSTQAHWNHVHNILSTNMNKKVPLMSKTVLEELMKQSAYNKQWVEGQFSNSQSRKISSKSSPRPQIGKEPLESVPQKNENLEEKQSVKNNDYYFVENEEGEEEDEIESSSEYNWSKYSDISRLKKAQDITIPKLKQSERQPQICTNTDHIPGLLPSGLKSSLLEAQVEQYERMNGSKARPTRVVNIEQLELDEEGTEEAEKHEKWIRQQMIMEDGIVEKYLDCGLDCFGLNLNIASNKQVQGEGTIQQQQERQVEERDEHKATLQKEHSNKMGKVEKQDRKNHLQPKDDDIFSNGAPGHHDNDDDMQLVYVFQNTDGRRSRENQSQHFDSEHANKNSKRNDNTNHLGNRDDSQKQSPSNIQPKEDSSPQSLLQPSFSVPLGNEQEPYTVEELSIQEELNTKRKQKITQQIITKLIEEFAYDVSLILRRSQNDNERKENNKLYKNNQPAGQRNAALGPLAATNPNLNANNNLAGMGIQTSFQSVRDFIAKIKCYVLNDQGCCRKIIENLKNNIGPSSIEILSYLRIEEQNQFVSEAEPEPEEEDNEEWLFVIPNDLFEVFNKKLLDEEEAARGKKLSNKHKLYTQFWHRSIFECYNECLDYERPYGITGAPYSWICEPKLPRPLSFSKGKVEQILESAESRLLDLTCSSSGLIFDKPDSPYREFELSEEHRVQLNEQKISRMLANQIIEDEYNWITYNDQITELLVDITRKIEELLIFQVSTDMKKIMRRRKMMAHVGRNIGMEQSSSEDDQHAVFLVQDLV